MAKSRTTKKHAPKKLSFWDKAAAAVKALSAKVKNTTMRQRMIAAPLLIAVVVGIAFVLFRVAGGQDNGDHDQRASYTDYQQELIGQVDNTTGAPHDGRDPANQRQTSLEEAASNPTLSGQRSDSVASGVSGGSAANRPSDNNGSLLNNSGCYYNYGDGGQCLAAHVAYDGSPTCADVRGHGGFPGGIVVNGKNHFKFADNNKNGIVCEPGEG